MPIISGDLATIAELAKQGGRLASDKQWVLADELAKLTEQQIAIVATTAGRNESTLLQYARAAERWDPVDRVEGVSFSAHRVALSWHDPRQLLIDLKHQHGSPTVRQVREAMGLEGHLALEFGRKMIDKLDQDVASSALDDIIAALEAHKESLKQYQPAPVRVVEDEDEDIQEDTQVTEPEPTPPAPVEEAEPAKPKGTWQPPVRTADVTGI